MANANCALIDVLKYTPDKDGPLNDLFKTRVALISQEGDRTESGKML